MDVLNLPQHPLKIKIENGKKRIFDVQRKRFVALTPEEWVRQNFVNYLCKDLNYPTGSLGNEILIKQNGLSRRCDTVIYNLHGAPVVICEYKAPEVSISQEVFDQIFAYNRTLNVKYLIISNGLKHFCCMIDDNGKPKFMQGIPNYNDL